MCQRKQHRATSPFWWACVGGQRQSLANSGLWRRRLAGPAAAAGRRCLWAARPRLRSDPAAGRRCGSRVPRTAAGGWRAVWGAPAHTGHSRRGLAALQGRSLSDRRTRRTLAGDRSTCRVRLLIEQSAASERSIKASRKPVSCFSFKAFASKFLAKVWRL